MNTPFETLVYEQDGPVVTVTLNRPAALNAMTVQMREELIRLIDQTDLDDTVRAVVFTGTGEKAFCAGFDLSKGDQAFAKSESTDGPLVPPDGGGLLALRFYRSRKPLIAAVNGAAVGIGATMQLPMDIRIASERARFAFVFARRGISPDGCSSWFLPRVVGIATAASWLYSGRMVSANEALARGLVSEVLPADAVLRRAQDIAKEMAEQCAPVSIAYTRQLLWSQLGSSHPEQAHAAESLALMHRGRSPDAKEGVASFLAKRAPDFQGKVSTAPPLTFFDSLS